MMRSVLWAVVMLLGSCMLQPAFLEHQPPDSGENTVPELVTEDGAGEIVIPERVNVDGQPIPHPRHHYLHKNQEHFKKQKVDCQEDFDTVYYKLQVAGKTMHLELRPNTEFVAAGIVFQHIGANGSVLSVRPNHDHCFYQGMVQGDVNSVATLSICRNLFGSIQTSEHHWLIEAHPNVTDDVDHTTQKPHVAFGVKGREQGMACNVEDHNRQHQRRKDSSSSSPSTTASSHSSNGNLSNAQPSYHSNTSNSSIPHHRQKRSMSWQRYVEMLVVADQKMAIYHGNDLHHYILALMSMVSSIYRHHSLGNAIQIVVVRVMVLNDPQAGPEISASAAGTLKNFCKWQHLKNKGDDTNPEHHDTAVLLTRQDICRAARQCDTLGLAELGTMCESEKSCSIIEDNGLSAAFTIVHEVGHVFNLPHDDSQKCIHNYPEQKKTVHVMASILDSNTKAWSWSRCSQQMMNEFLDGGYGECLLDKPRLLEYYHQTTDPHRLEPGEMYDLDKQCKQSYGNGSSKCPDDYLEVQSKPCEMLWCLSPYGEDKGCHTQHMPWADGTFCGHNMWCQKARCVPRIGGPGRSVDGGWGKWSPYGQCSRTCGGGIMKAKRECNTPYPANEGQYCIGLRIKYKSCNVDSCPKGSKTFREVQCARFNGRHFNINGLQPSVTWVPKYSGIQITDRCKLFCRVAGRSAYYQLNKMVEDGTKCGPETSDVCVNGQCRRAGCDNRLNSNTKEDRCGVCGGDNTSCQTITGVFNDQVRYGYNKVVRIPSGATSVDIRQHGRNKSQRDDNYLVLMDSSGTYLLNGNYVVTMFSKEVQVGGAKLHYSGPSGPVERINSSRMLKEDVEVLVLSVEDLDPPDIRYMYTISMPVITEFQWSRRGPWSKCSSICEGSKRRKVVCQRVSDKFIVSDQRCEMKNGRRVQKPREIEKRCKTHCSVEWSIIERSSCSSRCGQGYMTQKVRCVKQMKRKRRTSYTDDRHCLYAQQKPPESVQCQGQCLATHWRYQEWGKCSRSCGGGTQKRRAHCVDEHNRRLLEKECSHERKLVTQSCNEEQCARWIGGDWTGCSVTCGSGFLHRQVWCKQGNNIVSNDLCRVDRQPLSKKACGQVACPLWQASDWGQCSVTCGKGTKKRTVKCRSAAGMTLHNSECNAGNRPWQETVCYQPACSTTAVIVRKQHTQRHVRPWAWTSWRTGGWTECSVTCGEGSRARYVSCRDREGNIADDSACSHRARPPSSEPCNMRVCGQWRLGDWTECSVTCGDGQETRYVACVTMEDFEEQITSNAECEMSVRPSSERLCNRQLCVSQSNRYDISSISTNRVVGTSHWRIGPWGGCSSTCEGGWQRRQVVCQDENGSSNDCDPDSKPTEIQSCDSGPCPVWNFGAWESCPITCGGGGIQHRVVACQLPNGLTLPESSCDVMQRLPDKQACGSKPCVRRNHWQKRPWSQCSVTCGQGGHRTRQVVCVSPEGAIMPDGQCEKVRPRAIRRCREERCPRWTTGGWSRCSASCGNGTQYRDAQCIQSPNHTVPASLCGNLTRPLVTRTCRENKDCDRFQWGALDWSECSQTCGEGIRQRQIQCIETASDKTVHQKHCREDRKPKKKKKCLEMPCPFTWVTGDWSKCSMTCGLGLQTRSVTCHQVSNEGWVNPVASRACNVTERPSGRKSCYPGDCNALFHWQVTAWSDCSTSCGEGEAVRLVTCEDNTGNEHPARNCVSRYRPASRKTCLKRPCYASSCEELKAISSVEKDGEYSLLIGGKLLQIYCHGMSRQHPVEYVSLPTGEWDNYSEIYDKRLVHAYSCPSNGSRPGHDCPGCSRTPYSRAGVTTFSKVRLNITSLHIITTDLQFSSSDSAKKVAYATAGDCYSAHDCPQGQFKVNLEGTGLALAASESTWKSEGFQASKQIRISLNGMQAFGRCGGYCGSCFAQNDNGQPGLAVTVVS